MRWLALVVLCFMDATAALAGDNGQWFLSGASIQGIAGQFNATTYVVGAGESTKTLVMPLNIVVTDMECSCDSEPVGQTLTIQLRHNRAPVSGAICTITHSAPHDEHHGLAPTYAVNDELDASFTQDSESGSAIVSNCRITLGYLIQGAFAQPADAILSGGGASSGLLAVGSTSYCGSFGLAASPPGGSPQEAWSCLGTDPGLASLLIPNDCTLSGLGVRVESGLPSHVVETYTAMHKIYSSATTVATDLSVQLNSSTPSAVDTSCLTGCAMHQGDSVYVKDFVSTVTAFGAPAPKTRRWAISCGGIGQIVTQALIDIPTVGWSAPMMASAPTSTGAATRIARTSYAKNLTVLANNSLAGGAATVTVCSGTDPAALTCSALSAKATVIGILATDNNPSDVLTLAADSYVAVKVTAPGSTTGADLQWAFELADAPPPTWTPTVTRTVTQTPTPSNTSNVATPTPTQTNTSTSTPAAGCAVATFRPEVGNDDATLDSTGNGAAVLSTDTTMTAGKFLVSFFKIEQLVTIRWNTSALPDSATISGAWVLLHPTSVTNVGSRTLMGKWASGESPWAVGDFEDTLSVSDAFTAIPFSSFAVKPSWSIALTNLSNIDPISYTAIKFGGSGGDPSSGDQGAITFDSHETIGGSPATLIVNYCIPTATPTATATGTPAAVTATFTLTATPTLTPTLEPKPHRCPDLNGDGKCGIAFFGDEKIAMLLPALVARLGDPDMICDLTSSGIVSATLRSQVEAVTGIGANQNLCTEWGGIVRRGSDIPADIVLIDIGTVYDFVNTETGPRAGKCWGPNTPCTVAATRGVFDVFPAGKHRCVQGVDYGHDCTSTPCAGDPSPSDPFASYCQPNVFKQNDSVGVIGCSQPLLCQQRAMVSTVVQNIEAMVASVKASGAAPVLILPYLPATWLADPRADAPVPTSILPTGASVPGGTTRAPWEVAYSDLQWLIGWAHVYVDQSSLGPLAWIDLNRVMQIGTGGKQYRGLGDSRLASSEGAGSCSCLYDSDCN